MKLGIVLLCHLMVVSLQVYKGVKYAWSFPLGSGVCSVSDI